MQPIQRHFDLTGEMVIITGGAGFLGPVHAEAILEAGGVPVLLDINSGRVDVAVAQLRAIFPDRLVVGYTVDITDKGGLERVRDDLLDRFGKIDALINNAANNPAVTLSGAMSTSSRFETLSLEQWNADLAVGLTGAFLCTQVFGSCMARQQKGVIVNVSSDLGVISPDQRLYYQEGFPEEQQQVKPVTYSVVKTGIHGLTRYLATYWAEQHVRVNTISLGGVFNHQPIGFLERVHSRIPLGRLAAQDEYKGCIVFLCSAASSYMTGSNLVVDGGRTIW